MIAGVQEATLVWTLASALVVAVVAPYLIAFRRGRRHDRERLAEARALGIDRPTAQYPFVEPEHCIGCGACVRACPEGDVLGIVGGVAVVINGLRCVGHGRCADACPVGAIEIGLGDLRVRADVPLLTREQESTVPGVFVAGELTGLALIRNAVDQGSTVARTVAQRLARSSARGPASSETVDLLVVGAGPAGIATALAARESGLAVRVVDQAEGLGGTILHFPRRKMVLTRPVPLPGGGELSREEYSKEDLLRLLADRVAERRLDVRFGERLETISGGEGSFVVATTAARHRARYVVLALGRRGTPRKLGVPGEEREKVMYQLRDAESYERQRILVVGGGDSAVEAAVGLARQAGNRVTVSYRKSGFHRIKRKNLATIESMRASAKVEVLFDSEVVEIEEDSVTLRIGSSPGDVRVLDNDWVFVFAGGDPPYRLLESLGLRFGGRGGTTEPEPAATRRKRAGATVAGLVALLAFGAGTALAQENPHGAMDRACESCHTTADWRTMRPDAAFDHAETGFVLLGGHARLACADCHESRVFRHVGVACADCHADAHRGELGLDCAGCHDPRGWDVRSDFQAAHARRLMPLVAGHARVDCLSCHAGAPPRQFTALPTDCVACHRADFLAADTPAHGAVPSDCRTCHTGATWSGTSFRHPDRFPLSGGHATLACDDCHRGPASAVSAECFSCHRADYDGTRDPNHRTAGIPTQCAGCHTTTSWTSAVFDHFTTGFALDGAHRNAACASCHVSGYAGTPRDCYSCHRSDYDATRDPNHVVAGFSTSCQSCHGTTAWGGATFDHARSSFPLTGAHQRVDCASCHAAGYAGTPSDCYACHRADYEGTSDPNHAAAGFPTACVTCHTTTAWTGSAFDHSRTSFPLTGAHQSVACADCHTAGYAGTPQDCYSCHRADYEATNDPSHVAAGFSTSCASCHTTAGWTGASFDHSSTSFPLTGAHRTVACAQCHTSGYSGTPQDCYSCHRADYDGTTDPNHASAGFPTDCRSCHSTTSWEGATFDHDARYFPIYSGNHRGTWASCSTCHVVPSNYRAFECTTCHAHNRTDTDADHDQVGGYQYQSSACYSCHPDG